MSRKEIIKKITVQVILNTLNKRIKVDLMKIWEIVIYAIILIVLIGTAFLFNDKLSSTQNVTIQITSNNPWNGTLTSNTGSQIVNGNGDANYNLGTNPGVVSISLQNNGNGTLSVALLKGKSNVETQSTSNYKGVVNINHNF